MNIISQKGISSLSSGLSRSRSIEMCNGLLVNDDTTSHKRKAIAVCLESKWINEMSVHLIIPSMVSISSLVISSLRGVCMQVRFVSEHLPALGVTITYENAV